MADYIYLIPLLPLIGFLLLFTTLGKLPKRLVALVGVGSVASSATLVLLTALEFMTLGEPLSTTLYTWINVGGFSPLVSFYVDGLTLTMLSVITGVGLLIHIYSSLFMLDEKDYSRFFSYMNLFVSAMLVPVSYTHLTLPTTPYV